MLSLNQCPSKALRWTFNYNPDTICRRVDDQFHEVRRGFQWVPGRDILIEGLCNSFLHTTRLYSSTHPRDTLLDLPCPATSQKARRNGADLRSLRVIEHCRGSKNHCDKRKNFASTDIVVKMGDSNTATTATRTTNASAIVKIESCSQLTLMPATPNTSGYTVTYVNSNFVCWIRLEKLFCQANCLLIWSSLPEGFAALCERTWWTFLQNDRNLQYGREVLQLKNRK